MRYNSLNEYLRNRFGTKIYKLSLDGGFTCPNRDGTVGYKGCIFCSNGSGDFAVPCLDSVSLAIEKAKELVKKKSENCKYIAYFQSFTNTYAPIERLKSLYTEAITHPDIVAISIGTRPDCLDSDVVGLLSEINTIKPVFIELGLQTIHPKTAEYIRRGYDISVFDNTMETLNAHNIETVVHMIIGLPGETDEMIYDTARYIGESGAKGIKHQLLYVLRGTDLAEDYLNGLFDTFSMEKYFEILSHCIEILPPEMIIHRLTGDGAKKDLLSPLWSADKKNVMNSFNRYIEENNIVQGSCYGKR